MRWAIASFRVAKSDMAVLISLVVVLVCYWLKDIALDIVLFSVASPLIK